MKKLMNLIGVVCVTVASQFFPLHSQAHAIEVMDIVKKTNHAILYQGNDAKAKVDMRIIDDKGRERVRQMTIMRKNMDDADGPQKYYVYFSKPADIKKMVFMAWKNIEQDDDRWLYLPALDLVKRIAASDDRTSFVGSHFFYEDVSGRNIDEDTHELLEETAQHYIVKSTPKNPREVEFKFYKNWVNKNTFLPSKAEYYDDKEFLYRSYQVLSTDLIEGYPTVISAQMEDHISGGKTILTYSKIRYDNAIPEKIFSERYLRRAPKKYLR